MFLQQVPLCRFTFDDLGLVILQIYFNGKISLHCLIWRKTTSRWVEGLNLISSAVAVLTFFLGCLQLSHVCRV